MCLGLFSPTEKKSDEDPDKPHNLQDGRGSLLQGISVLSLHEKLMRELVLREQKAQLLICFQRERLLITGQRIPFLEYIYKSVQNNETSADR